MDEEDEYGIPHDYYSSEGSFRNYPENFPPSSFDGHLEDTLGDSQLDSFGECECMRPTLVYFRAKLYATNRVMEPSFWLALSSTV